MNFDLMFQPMRKYADFNGRAQRAEYWWFTLFFTIVCVPLAILSGASEDVELAGRTPFQTIALALLSAFIIAVLTPCLAVTVRRLHDLNRSGWWALCSLIPYVGTLGLAIFFCFPGTAGSNRFGPDPLGRAQGPDAPVIVS